VDLKNAVALITGGSAGIGRSIAQTLSESGARVAITGRNQARLEETARALGVVPIHADVSNERDVERTYRQLLEKFGDLDILVNNAGVAHLPQPLEGLTEDFFDRILAVNVKAIYLAARHAVPRFKAKKSGVILNIASTAGVSPRPNLTWYNASKGWVITATRSMAVELAPFGLRVNALNPVAGETPLLKTFLGEDTPERRAKFLATIPLGRFSTPQDMGNAATFLCSDAASMITGVALEVDGGRCI
jgi:3-oxoacyl-[acyl-carrier protein] reductase